MSQRIQQTIEANIINEIGRSCILFLREERQSKVAVLVAIRVTGERLFVFQLGDKILLHRYLPMKVLSLKNDLSDVSLL